MSFTVCHLYLAQPASFPAAPAETIEVVMYALYTWLYAKP